MKKIILLPLLVWGFATAAEAPKATANTEAKTEAATMKGLEKSMATIQKGLLYNNESMVKEGTDGIKKNALDIDSFDIKNKENPSFKAKRYSKNEAKAISNLADDMIKAFHRKDKNRILDTYRKMQNRCMTCHKLVRKW